MKKLLVLFALLAITLAGCSTLNTALDIADIFIEDKPIHTAEVQSVTKSKDVVTIIFIEGHGYEITNNPYVNPGDTVSIFREEDGSYRAEVE